MSSRIKKLSTVAIYLIRNDMRIHDNECLQWCLGNARHVIPLLCLDRSMYGREARTWTYKFPRNSDLRTRFIAQSARDLRQSYRKLGSNLLVRTEQTTGDAVAEMIRLCKEHSCSDAPCHITLVYQKEITKEETDIEQELGEVCAREEVAVKTFWGLTLYHVDDLPYPSVQNVPDFYTAFRKKVENPKNGCVVRPLIPTPATLPALPAFMDENSSGELQMAGENESADNASVGHASAGHASAGNASADNASADNASAGNANANSAFPFEGGETAALGRLEDYLFATDNVKTYKDTRNGLLGADYSTKFSPWLANGALSPRRIYHRVKEYERQRKGNDSTYWVLFELLWRDYFKFISVKHGDRIFYRSGIKNRNIPWKRDMELFDKWRNGETGVPFVDANMRELLQTGWMSNRGRQNVASFLVKDLGIDWRLGAEWFESQLLDHDVSSNYGNWNYAAGIGNDQRTYRKFNMIKQARDYDADGDYVRAWVPELRRLSDGRVHMPWCVTRSELKAAGVVLGGNYPHPMIQLDEWQRHPFKAKSSRGKKRMRQSTLQF